MNRRRFFAGASGIILAAAFPFEVGATQPLVWTSGGHDPYGGTDEQALRRFVVEGIISEDSGRQILGSVSSGRREFSEDPIPEGIIFEAMHFGGKNSGSIPKLRRHVIAQPSAWQKSAPRDMRTWYATSTAPDGSKETVAYARPLVCGNSSVIRYLKGEPVCVPLPPQGTYKTV